MDGISVFGKLRSTLCDVPVLTHLNTHNFPSYPLSAFSYCASESDYKLYLITCLQFRAGTHDTTNVGRHRQWRNYNSPPLLPPANIRYGLTVLIPNSGHFVPPLPFWAPGPPAWPGLPMASYAIRYDTRCYFNVRSKADISQLNLPHGSLIYRHWSRGPTLSAHLFIETAAVYMTV